MTRANFPDRSPAYGISTLIRVSCRARRVPPRRNRAADES
jgi:hypothetical protein